MQLLFAKKKAKLISLCLRISLKGSSIYILYNSDVSFSLSCCFFLAASVIKMQNSSFPKSKCLYCISGNFNLGSVDLSISGLMALWDHELSTVICRIVECVYMNLYSEESPLNFYQILKGFYYPKILRTTLLKSSFNRFWLLTIFYHLPFRFSHRRKGKFKM